MRQNCLTAALFFLQSLAPWWVVSQGCSSTGMLYNCVTSGGLFAFEDDDVHKRILQKIENCTSFSEVYSVSEEVGSCLP